MSSECNDYQAHISDSVYDEFAKLLAEKVGAFKVGPGFDEGV
jgi:succinate-semialdehyde dehydrogenase/glutarate-semialdehyde dehydrogenase